jgi:hypothetical protein
MGQQVNIDLVQVWRDKPLLEDLRSEIKRQALQGWRPWELRLPPELLWPMVEEVSQGMVQEWSPRLDGIAVQLGDQHEVAVRFVLKDMPTSPVMVRSLPYHGGRPGDTKEGLVVRNGSPV